jgi:hypothetical protein
MPPDPLLPSQRFGEAGHRDPQKRVDTGLSHPADNCREFSLPRW